MTDDDRFDLRLDPADLEATLSAVLRDRGIVPLTARRPAVINIRLDAEATRFVHTIGDTIGDHIEQQSLVLDAAPTVTPDDDGDGFVVSYAVYATDTRGGRT